MAIGPKPDTDHASLRGEPEKPLESEAPTMTDDVPEAAGRPLSGRASPSTTPDVVESPEPGHTPSEGGVDWEEVESSAVEMFSIWMSGADLAWAKEAWGHLGRAGLTPQGSIIEATSTRIRLVTLARICHEFCDCGWDETPCPLGLLIPDDLDIDDVALGILAGACEAPFDDIDLDAGHDLRIAALAAVSNSQRHEIFECLKSAYGGGRAGLYKRLWCIGSGCDEDEAAASAFQASEGNMRGWNYVMGGFPADYS